MYIDFKNTQYNDCESVYKSENDNFFRIITQKHTYIRTLSFTHGYLYTGKSSRTHMHGHARTNTNIRTLALIHMHERTHTHARTISFAHVHTLKRKRTHARTHAHTGRLTLKHIHACLHSLTYTHAYVHTCTHRHAHEYKTYTDANIHSIILILSHNNYIIIHTITYSIKQEFL